jgi:hypothetical protein
MLKKILIIFGGSLITVSLAVSLVFSMFLYQVIYEPEQIGILKWLASKMPQTNEALSGTINDSHFAIYITEPFRLIACVIAITFCLSIFVGIFHIIVAVGIDLIKLGTSFDTAEKFDNKF